MKTLLLTGATGFLGRNILPVLQESFDSVTTLGRSSSNDITADLSCEIPLLGRRFDSVIHAAGKAHVLNPATADLDEFYNVNFQGTVNLCKALDAAGTMPKQLVFISSVAVYGPEAPLGADESAPLEATSAYGRSKIEAERFLEQWCEERGVLLTILRLPLLVGPDAPGNLGAMTEAIRRGRYFNIGRRPVLKSMLCVEDGARALPFLMSRGGVFNLCASQPVSVADLAACIARAQGRRKPITIPAWIMRLGASFGDFVPGFPLNSVRLEKLTHSLVFSNAKALATGWQPDEIAGIKHFAPSTHKHIRPKL